MLERQQINNQRMDLAVGAVDSLNITAIFIMFLTEVMRRLLEETAHFILFPIAMAASIIKASLAWRQAKLENGKNGTIGRAIVETVAAVTVSVAVVGGLVAAATFATIAPLIFSITLGIKSLFHMGSAGYYWGKSVVTKDPEKKTQYQSAAQAHAIGAVALVLATVAVSFVMLLAKPVVAVVGIAAGVISGGFCFYKLFKSGGQQTPAKQPLIASEQSAVKEPTVSTRLHQRFSPKPDLKPAVLTQASTNKPAEQKKAFWEKANPVYIPNLNHARERRTVPTFSRSL